MNKLSKILIVVIVILIIALTRMTFLYIDTREGSKRTLNALLEAETEIVELNKELNKQNNE